MAKSPNGLDLLLEPSKHTVGPLCAVSGDEAFLKREVLHELRRQVCGGGDGDFAWNVFTGKEADWRDVHDALTAVSLFGGGGQAALVEDADTFVSAHREQLENYIAKPPSGATLVLEVKTWNGSTRLAKAAAEAGGLALKCSAPDRGAELGAYKRQVKQWLAKRADQQHGARDEQAHPQPGVELTLIIER